MVFRDGRGYVALTRSEGEDKEPKYIIMNSQAVDIAIDEIDGILCQLKELLKILGEYLCSHINILPIEACMQGNLQ